MGIGYVPTSEAFERPGTRYAAQVLPLVVPGAAKPVLTTGAQDSAAFLREGSGGKDTYYWGEFPPIMRKGDVWRISFMCPGFAQSALSRAASAVLQGRTVAGWKFLSIQDTKLRAETLGGTPPPEIGNVQGPGLEFPTILVDVEVTEDQEPNKVNLSAAALLSWIKVALAAAGLAVFIYAFVLIRSGAEDLTGNTGAFGGMSGVTILILAGAVLYLMGGRHKT